MGSLCVEIESIIGIGHMGTWDHRPSPVCRGKETHDRELYLLATSLAGGKKSRTIFPIKYSNWLKYLLLS